MDEPPGREHSSTVMESWGGRASMAGGLQGMRRRRKRKYGIERGKGRKKGKTERKRERHEKEKRGGGSIRGPQYLQNQQSQLQTHLGPLRHLLQKIFRVSGSNEPRVYGRSQASVPG